MGRINSLFAKKRISKDTQPGTSRTGAARRAFYRLSAWLKPLPANCPNNMAELGAKFLPYGVLFSHILLAVLFLALLFRNSWGARLSSLLGKHALILSFLVSLAAVLGSLFYSEIIGFEPCVLCWWQRIFLYPLVLIFGIAIWKKIPSVFVYAVSFAMLAALVGAYQYYASLGGVSLLSCIALEGACSKIYVMAFGYMTIPLMSLTVSLYILLLAWADKIFKNENSNS